MWHRKMDGCLCREHTIENVYSGKTVLGLERFTATHAAALTQGFYCQTIFAYNKHPPHLQSPPHQHTSER